MGWFFCANLMIYFYKKEIYHEHQKIAPNVVVLLRKNMVINVAASIIAVLPAAIHGYNQNGQKHHG